MTIRGFIGKSGGNFVCQKVKEVWGLETNLELGKLLHKAVRLVTVRFGGNYGNSKCREKLKFLVGELYVG